MTIQAYSLTIGENVKISESRIIRLVCMNFVMAFLIVFKKLVLFLEA